jgi:hypothetical protein
MTRGGQVRGGGRFVESRHDSRIAHWAHEPRRGSPPRHGGTEVSTVCLVSLCLRDSVMRTWFVESALFEIDLHTDHEPGIPGGETPAATEARCMVRRTVEGHPRR